MMKAVILYRLRSISGIQHARLKSTIYALSSGFGKCGVAVIRVSGPRASDAILNMTCLKYLPKPRIACLNKIIDPLTKEQLDNGLILWFPGPKSFTGENSCEFQVHGGRAVVTSVLHGLSKLCDFRPADPGEFTKRSFYNNKMDLTEVEGLADLIEADTEFQRKQALMQLEGSLKHLYSSWRQILLENLANVEAYIDFSETDNIDIFVLENVKTNLEKLSKEIKTHLLDNRSGELLRDGVKVAIIGAPNTGKSSLLNALCSREAAIVTELPGTTRDPIQVSLDVSGYSVLLVDTAGIRSQSTDLIEELGIQKSKDKAQEADMVILVVDAQYLLDVNNIDLWLQEYTHNMKVECNNYLVYVNKIDIIPKDQVFRLEKISQVSNWTICFGSCKADRGLADMMEIFRNNLQKLCGNPNFENPRCTQARHRYCLTEALNNIKKYLEISKLDNNIDIAAQPLRKATVYVGKITGHISTEEMLNIIFSKFCIGK
ncbi:GTP-binding protein TrmE, N-terminal,GTP binding domain,MnmE, helical domain,TrmE-type guanine nucleotide- [Cinara cedri]|uniref:GTP-binding protein TrmE, N-terminal,GTP binding domain,MnmE, helical domain,TrmE-type guanine nucleotide n=1 Tax=Cinara cedri TaxID=506608 RepID=A0A5E4M5X5_9HEMI|nr:GTP-binding protein TrmE, N-terminal,GTP binding domain,MnmE, helical domain,TrmE-type guanine nucleotide- [Cinara cedri]